MEEFFAKNMDRRDSKPCPAHAIQCAVFTAWQSTIPTSGVAPMPPLAETHTVTVQTRVGHPVSAADLTQPPVEACDFEVLTAPCEADVIAL